MFWLARLLGIVLLLSACSVQAQLQEVWRVVFPNYVVQDFVATPSGDLLFAQKQRTGTNDILQLVRVNGAGKITWTLDLGSFWVGSSPRLAVDASESIYIATRPTNSVGYTLLKFSSAGQFLWQSSESEIAQSAAILAIDAQGNLCMGGIIGSNLQRQTFWFGGYGTNGSKLWRTNFTLGTNTAASLAGMEQSGDGHWTFGGEVIQGCCYRGVVGRLSTNGVLGWVKAVDTVAPSFRYFKTFQAGENGSIYVSGENTAKLNADGSLAWMNTNGSFIVQVDKNNSRFFMGETEWGYPSSYLAYPSLSLRNADGEVRWKSAMPQEPLAVLPSGPGKWLGAAVNRGWWGEPIRVVSFDDSGRQFWQATLTNFYQLPSGQIKFMAGSNGIFRLIANSGNQMVVAGFREVALEGLPSIVEQPQSVTARAGEKIQLRVTATGTGPLFYHWQRTGISASVLAGPVFPINNSTPTDSGKYFVKVSNAVGVVYSDLVTVRVLRAPFIIQETTEVSAALNSELVLSAGVDGDGTLLYQWYQNGSVLKDQTNAVLRLPTIAVAQTGNYSVIVSNEVGQISHVVAQVQVAGSVSQERVYRSGRDACCKEVGLGPESDGSVYLLAGGQIGKFSPNGQLLWGASNHFRRMVLDGQGGVVADGDIVTARYSPVGTMLWGQWDLNLDGLELWNGNLAEIDRFINVFDMNGNFRFELIPQITNANFISARKVVPSPDGGLIYSGMAQGLSGRSQLILTKWNKAGEQLWAAQPMTLGGEENISSQDFAVGPDGSVLFSAIISGDGYRRQVTGRVDATGPKTTENREGSGYDDLLVQVAVDQTGAGVVVREGKFVKYDSQGSALWSMGSGHPTLGVVRPRMMRLDAAGNIYLLGAGQEGEVLEKLDPEGNSLWVTLLPWSKEYIYSSSLELGTNGVIYAAASFYTNFGIVKFQSVENAQTPIIAAAPSPAQAVRHPGENVTFTGVVAGASPVEVRWRHGNGYVTNAIEPSLNLQNLTVNDSGYYYLEARNAYGLVLSRPVVLRVGSPPEFELTDRIPPFGQPEAAEYLRVNEGESLRVYTMLSNNWEETSWQWYLNAAEIPGANSGALVLTNVTRAMAGTISVRGTNIFGATERSLRLYVESDVKPLFNILEVTNLAYTAYPPGLGVNKAGEIFLAVPIGLEPFDPGANQAWVLNKYSQGGKVLWRVTSLHQGSPFLQLDADGNAIVASGATTNAAIWLTKVSPAGSTLWKTKLQMAPGHIRDVSSLVMGRQGEFYVAGFDATESGDLKVFVSKVSYTGKEVWTLYFPTGEASFLANAPYLAPYPSGGVCLASPRGITRITDTAATLWTVGTNFLQCAVDSAGAVYGAGYHTAKYSSYGKRQWGSVRHGLGLQADKNGLVGFSYDFVGERQLLAKNSLEGTPVWSTSVNGTALITDADGSIYVSGGLYGPPVTRKFNRYGEERWAGRGLSDEWDCRSEALALCENGDLVAAHYVFNFTNSTVAYHLIRYQQAATAQTSYVRVTPANAVLQMGRPVTLTASTGGVTNYRLQWYKNGSIMAGQTNLTLRLPGDVEDEGIYQVRLFASNKVLSSVEVPVRGALPTVGIGRTGIGNAFYFQAIGENWAYPPRLQTSTNFVHWTDTGRRDFIISTNTPAQFFRAIQTAP